MSMTVPATAHVAPTRRQPRPRPVQDAGRLPVVPEAARRADEEPGSDQPDGLDAVHGPARGLQPGRAVGADRTPSSTRCCSRRRWRRPTRIIGRTVTSADGDDIGKVAEVQPRSPTASSPCSKAARRSPIGAGVKIVQAPAKGAHMNEADALDIVQYAIWTVLTASGPAVAAAMLVGVGIALVQALTQIQEITLTFVPKIVAIMLVVAFTGPFIGARSRPSPTSSSSASRRASRLGQAAGCFPWRRG